MVRVRAGEEAKVAIDFDQPAAPAETTLTVRVPADADVYLEGQKTHSKGTVRQYKTSQLSPGQKWEAYTVRVTWERNGKPVTKERTLTLEGGKSQEVTFAFDRDVIAQAR